MSPPTTRAGRIFASFYIFFGTLLAAKALTKLVSLPLQRSRQRLERAVESQFGNRLTPKRYRAIHKKVRRLNLPAPNPDTVTPAEFTLAMLVSLGRITEGDVQECAESFHQLDRDRTGVLRAPTPVAPSHAP